MFLADSIHLQMDGICSLTHSNVLPSWLDNSGEGELSNHNSTSSRSCCCPSLPHMSNSIPGNESLSLHTWIFEIYKVGQGGWFNMTLYIYIFTSLPSYLLMYLPYMILEVQVTPLDLWFLQPSALPGQHQATLHAREQGSCRESLHICTLQRCSHPKKW